MFALSWLTTKIILRCTVSKTAKFTRNETSLFVICATNKYHRR